MNQKQWGLSCPPGVKPHHANRSEVGFWSCAPGQELLPRGQARGLGQVAVAQDPQWEQEAGGGTRQWDKLAWRG